MIETGTLLQNRFLIEEQIGIGGMGAVYRAVDQKFGTSVAIKETFYSDAALAEAFEREARLLNGLHHPMFPHVSDHFIEGNGHFLVMEYVEGEDLSDLLKRGERFSFDTVMMWTIDLLDGLDYLHSQDPPIIHRDVKPSNLKLTTRGNLVLLDFGMAKETSGNTQGIRSVFGYSRRYSPLEQIEGTGTDVRSDIFSLGATVYHLLTGTPPVDVLARASAIVAGRPDPLQLASDVDETVPKSIAATIHRALALDPDKRFVSARAMWKAIDEAMGLAPAAGAILPASISPGTDTHNFAALEAFENDPDIDTNARSERIQVPIFSKGVSGGVQPRSTTGRRTLRRQILGAATALLVAGLFAFGLYQRSIPADDALNSEVPVESVPAQTEISQDAPVMTAESEATEADTANDQTPGEEASLESKQKQKTSNDTIASGTKKSSNEVTANDPVSKTTRSANRSSGGSRRTRVIDPERTRQAPVSSIESILTGMPDRTGQQRQWDLWREEEELRRQRRIRRQIRRNQPF
jgi:serine/threonine protein kinase